VLHFLPTVNNLIDLRNSVTHSTMLRPQIVQTSWTYPQSGGGLPSVRLNVGAARRVERRHDCKLVPALMVRFNDC
jgi:hypothetical protein